MRILITNHSLRDLAGTELATFELARELKLLGHQVGVFSPFLGRFAFREAFRSKIPLFSIENAEAIRKFDPDVVHLQHWPNHLILKSMGVHAPRLFHFHGPRVALETPPPITGRTPTWIAVSDLTLESVSEVSLWNAAQGSRIPKWGNEAAANRKDRVPPKSGRTQRKALVVSNHFPESYSEMLNSVANQLGIEIIYVGRGHSVKPVTAEMILDSDFVVTLGRTAIFAATLGKPVLILDSLGLDGWITREGYGKLEATGFSGMAFQNREFSREILLDTILNMPLKEETDQMAEVFSSNHDLKSIAKQIELKLQTVSRETQDFEFERSSRAAVLYIEKLHQAEMVFRPIRSKIFASAQKFLEKKYLYQKKIWQYFS